MANLTKTELEALWEQVGGSAATADVASAVALAESRGDVQAVDNTFYAAKAGFHQPSPGAEREYSLGLWQINQLAHPTYDEATLLSANGNAAAALAISNEGADFGQWSTFVSGAYRAFLEDVIGGALGTGSGQPPTPGTTTPPALPRLKGFATPPKVSPNFFSDPLTAVEIVLNQQAQAAAGVVPASVTGAWQMLTTAMGVTVPANVNRQIAASQAFAKIVG